MCGFERNFIRCDDVPIVFTQIVSNTLSSSSSQSFNLVIAHSDFIYPFIPESLFMLPESINNDVITEKNKSDKDDENEDEESVINTLKHGGRIYHRADERFGGYGLIRSSLAQEIGNNFVLNDNNESIAFKWNDEIYYLNNELANKINNNK